MNELSIEALAIGLQSGTVDLKQLTELIAQQPQHSQLYFLRGSEWAEQGDLVAARADFATAVLLEPDFALARLQYCFCCLTPQALQMVPVLLQPLLQRQDSIALFSHAMLLLILQHEGFYDAYIDLAAQLEQKADLPPALILNLKQLAAQLSAVAPVQMGQVPDNISPVLLEIYQKTH
jgi:hypothetical protein